MRYQSKSGFATTVLKDWNYQETDAIVVAILDKSYTKNTAMHLRIRSLEQLLLHENLYFSAYLSISISAICYFFNGA